MFIGVYNLANFVTLTGLASSVAACALAAGGCTELAVCMFLVSGLCDMCDGRIARGACGRTHKEKVYGIQIDTVCDMVSFGVTPAVIAYCSGFDKWYDVAVYIVYTLCAAIRLAYFNTQAIEETEDLNMKSFTGVPVPFSCMVVPVLVIIGKLIDNAVVVNVINDVLMLGVGIAFIANVKIKKMNLVQSICLVIFELAAVILMFTV